MGTWSEEFVNVAEAQFADVRAAGGLAGWIAQRLASTNPSGRRRVLYFPPHPTPGLDTRRTDAWVLEPSPVLVLQPEVEVRIAPGAKVVLWGANTRLEIRGALTAPVAQVFEVPRPANDSSPGVGEVYLLGDRIECVHPEWWGAGHGEATVDTPALQQAIYVAQRRLRPIPVELLGRYVLQRPLVLTVPQALPPFQGVELRGRFAGGGDACLRAGDDFRGSALVIVPPTMQSMLLHAVSFDARGQAERCLEVWVAGSTVAEVTRAPHTLRQCAFGGATLAQVAVTRSEAGERATLPPTVSHAPGLQVLGCVFSPTASSVGILLSGPPDSVASLSGCTFAGQALAMVHVQGQGVTLTSCRFHNPMVPARARGVGGRIDWEGFHRTGPEGGIDIYIDREAYTVLLLTVSGLTPAEAVALAVLGGPAAVAIGALAAGGVNNRVVSPRTFRGALGWFAAQDCRSSSLQHVAVARHTPEATEPAVRNSVVIGAHHACNPLPPATTLARGQLPPAIFWRAPAAQGGTLSLTGCRFDGLDRMGYPKIMRSGVAKLEGKVGWVGSPQSPDLPTLTGDLKLFVEKGQFLKADPGVAKLLGVLSLQSLVTMDLRDLFREGFSYDTINGTANVSKGIMTTKDFFMKGASAQVAISGVVDLPHETQNLHLRVVPSLGDGASTITSVLMANPLLGITATLLQRLLKDPLGQIFAVEYDVTGTWNDPVVTRTKVDAPREKAQE